MPGYWRTAGYHARFWQPLTEGSAEGWVLCLAGEAERKRKAPDYREFLEAAKLGERWLEFPIRDRSVPRDLQAFLGLLDRLIGLLHRPTTVLAIHCAAGVGRTGTVAASLLVRIGLPHDEGLTLIEEAGSEPETARQFAFARSIEALTPDQLAAIAGQSSEDAILSRLLEQLDAPEIRMQLTHSGVYRPDDLVPGDQALPRLMRCIQTSDLDFRGRSLNEIVNQALAI
ncbi:hypothetical protein OJ996_05420 [Luteolibacter sp. GHJ8]|uniref:Tyrosine specific protein phosphatases domain-containing protein n=1 Tax=Luteolibacter rhizosphaerae TaxID=2989719 RepID=A0ABT3G090_9BACT|nr:hypothetical protein [Luteolibacter rhizosphaerae]MCW1912999.1 hypothetical protein [Luteolibacter rhizosphaerae]